jgi:hypothetical protein
MVGIRRPRAEGHHGITAKQRAARQSRPFEDTLQARTKARKGTNPFTGEPMTFKAKPATLQPRFTAAKAIKDVAAKHSKKLK